MLGVPGDWSLRERPAVSEGVSLWYVGPGKEAGPPRGTMLENLGREDRVHEGQLEENRWVRRRQYSEVKF